MKDNKDRTALAAASLDAMRPIEPRTFTFAQAAKLVGVSPDTLRRWADKDPAICTTPPNGRRRVILANLTPYIQSAKTDTANG